MPRPRPGAPLPPVSRHPPALLDERSEPDFRRVFTSLLGRASATWSALTRVRLAGLDLREREVRRDGSLRVLLAQVGIHDLRLDADAALSDADRGESIRLLVRLVREGRLEVRSAPLAGWTPDFTVFHRAGGPWALLAGHHWFSRPYPHRGPAFASLHGSGAALRAAARFMEVWETAHDISLPILGVLEEAERRAPPAADRAAPDGRSFERPPRPRRSGTAPISPGTRGGGPERVRSSRPDRPAAASRHPVAPTPERLDRTGGFG